MSGVPRYVFQFPRSRVMPMVLPSNPSTAVAPRATITLGRIRSICSATLNKNPILLVETVRQALGRALVQPLLGDDGKLTVIQLDSTMEEQLAQILDPQLASRPSNALQPSLIRRILEGLKKLLGEPLTVPSPIVLCSSPTRFHLRRLLEPFLPRLVVLSPAEIPAAVSIQSLGVVQ